jgi:site-specific DNA-cytosine methylase
MKNYKWGTIVPLLGGLTVAGKQVLGKDPDFLISYAPFADNERNVKANFPNVPHYLLDSENFGGFDINQNVDIVSAVCPCAGLSMLSTGSDEQRAGMNHWMMESAKFVTGKLKPKVFWGENAPGLYTSMGDNVRAELRDIAKQNGYTFSVYLTNTIYHGIPQYRRRTFYFFWKGDTIPYFKFFRTPYKTLGEYLAEVPDGVSGQTVEDKQKATDKLASSHPFMFLQDKYKGEGIKKFIEHYNYRRPHQALGYKTPSELFLKM